jgi:hypothetical protein
VLIKIFYVEGSSKNVTRSHPVVEVIHQQGENMDEKQLPSIKEREIITMSAALEFAMK